MRHKIHTKSAQIQIGSDGAELAQVVAYLQKIKGIQK